jgi:hypothetical protein
MSLGRVGRRPVPVSAIVGLESVGSTGYSFEKAACAIEHKRPSANDLLAVVLIWHSSLKLENAETLAAQELEPQPLISTQSPLKRRITPFAARR